MSLASRYPIVGLVVGIALVVLGIARGETLLIIIGVVLLVLAAIRRFRG